MKAFKLKNGKFIDSTSIVHNHELLSDILNNLYPIGRGFIDFTDTDYSSYLGFTWERELVGMFPVGYKEQDSSFGTIGNTGGEREHTLTIDEMPNHRHSIAFGVEQGGDLSAFQANANTYGYTSDQMTSTGNNYAHNNLPPYKVVAYWKRVA